MKFKEIIKISMFLITVLGFNACELDPDQPPVNTVDADKIITISDIYQIYADSVEDYTFTEDYMVYATVTMDDNEGNIYKEAYIQDETGGINLYRLSSSGATNQGDYVRLNLNGAVLTYYSGKLELVYDAVDDIERNIIVQNSDNPIIPAEVTIDSILSGDYNAELVKVKDVQFIASELTQTYANMNDFSSQNRTLEDCNGHSIVVRTSDYSNFASDTVAQGKGDIIGVLTKYVYSGGDIVWQLLIRSTDEIYMDNPRCGE